METPTLDSADSEALEPNQGDTKPGATFLSEECLSELAHNLAIILMTTPMSVSALIEIVFQELVRQFYEKGRTYLPNFGWILFEDGDIVFSKNSAMQGTLAKMQASLLLQDQITLALGERRIEEWIKSKSGEDCGNGLEIT